MTFEIGGVKMYPLEQYYHYGKGDPRPWIHVVKNGEAVVWDGCTLHFALTAIHDKRNNQDVDMGEFKVSSLEIYRNAKEKDVAGMKQVIREHPTMVPQAEEILDLPDEMFVRAAMYMTEAIW